jgi:hypothetical protein
VSILVTVGAVGNSEPWSSVKQDVNGAIDKQSMNLGAVALWAAGS